MGSIRLLCVLLLFIVIGCKDSAESSKTALSIDKGPYSYVKGKTMGTTYSIVHHNPNKLHLKPSIDSLLEAFNLEVSTYIPTATISKFNSGSGPITIDKDNTFYQNYALSKKIWEQTDGFFDPTVMPLVNYYGFGTTKKSGEIQQDSIQDLMSFVGFEKVVATPLKDSIRISKTEPRTSLDFSAIAKGFGVDLVASFLVSKGITDYLVEIGGETVVKGQSPKKRDWIIGVNTPEENASTKDMYSQIYVSDIGIATSGNYRNFYEENGKKVTHTINPKTGESLSSKLLSATILAPTCAEADAYATACMVMGLDKAMVFVKKHQIAAYFIFNDKNELKEFVSEQMQPYFSNHK